MVTQESLKFYVTNSDILPHDLDVIVMIVRY